MNDGVYSHLNLARKQFSLENCTLASGLGGDKFSCWDRTFTHISGFEAIPFSGSGLWGLAPHAPGGGGKKKKNEIWLAKPNTTHHRNITVTPKGWLNNTQQHATHSRTKTTDEQTQQNITQHKLNKNKNEKHERRRTRESEIGGGGEINKKREQQTHKTTQHNEDENKKKIKIRGA